MKPRPRYLQADFFVAATAAVAMAIVARWITKRGVDGRVALLGYLGFLWLLLDILTRRMVKDANRHLAKQVHSGKGVATVWPPLPDDPIVRDRGATPDDVEAGRALFFMEEMSGKRGTPVAIELPQYGLVDSKPVAILQAETDGESTFLGYLNLLSGEPDVSALHEVTLLGRTPPTHSPSDA